MPDFFNPKRVIGQLIFHKKAESLPHNLKQKGISDILQDSWNKSRILIGFLKDVRGFQ